MSDERNGKRDIGGARDAVARFALVAVATAGLAVPAAAQSVLLFAPFDDDEEGWAAADADSVLVWSDPEASPACPPHSGSALATHGGPDAGAGRNFVPPTCLWPVEPGATYRAGASYLFPTGQDRTGSVRLVVVWTNAANCGGTVVGSVNTPDVTTVTAGGWVGQIAEFTPPAGAVSASLRVRMQKTEAGGALDLHFDEVFLTRGRAAFFDGVENGTSCRWTMSVD